jgi:hypothetical protein
MSRAPGRFRVFLANLLWFLACLPGWALFCLASLKVRRTQAALLGNILRRNAATQIGRAHAFAAIQTPDAYTRVPLGEYADYVTPIEKVKTGTPAVLTRDPVELLQPTSGSTAATKLIPCTPSLRREFKAAIDPWIASLYLAYPSLLFGRHYWSISPTTRSPETASTQVPIGFADDAEYLGRAQRRLSRALLVVPPEIARVTNHEAFEYLTLLFLLHERGLRLISIWHPSFLTVLLKALPKHLPSLLRDIEWGSIAAGVAVPSRVRDRLLARGGPNPARAAQLRRLDPAWPDFPQSIWPKLRVISCWTDGRAEPWLSELARAFPRAAIQGKGLTATEGIVSFPLGRQGRRVCAVRSHFFEFIETETGRVRNAWNLTAGKTYAVVLTTGGGLYRYKLHDIVRVTGFFGQAPCLAFVGRDNLVSDIVGEKLSAQHVDDCLRAVEERHGLRFAFAMLAPAVDGAPPGYVLHVQLAAGAAVDHAVLGSDLDKLLCGNYHYRHARNIRQLQPLRVFNVCGDASAAYREFMLRKGQKAGDIKFLPLSTDTGWNGAFRGQFVA